MVETNFTCLVPGAVGGKPEGNRGSPCKHCGTPVPQPQALCSFPRGLGSSRMQPRRQQTQWCLWRPFCCCLPLFSVGFERFICCHFPESNGEKQGYFMDSRIVYPRILAIKQAVINANEIRPLSCSMVPLCSCVPSSPSQLPLVS